MFARYALCLGFAGFSVLGLAGCQQRQPLRGSGPATVEELIARFESATRSNDVESLASLLAPPADEVLRARINSIRGVRDAVANLTRECDSEFGPNSNQSPFVFESPLADRVLNRVFPDRPPGQPKGIRIEVVNPESLASGKVQLSVREHVEIDGEAGTREELVTAIQTADGWKLESPADPAGPDPFEKEKQLADYIRLITEEIQTGQFRTREEVDFLMAREFVRFLPDVLSETGFDSTLKADAVRLGLSAASPPSEGIGSPSPELQVVIPGDQPGDSMRFSATEGMVETLPEEVPGRIEQAARDLGLPAGFRILVTVKKGADSEQLMEMLHRMLDLRTDSLRPEILFAIESPSEFEPVMNRFTGRLRLLGLEQPEYSGSNRPETESPPEELKLDRDLLLPEGPDFGTDLAGNPGENTRPPQSDHAVLPDHDRE